jgi:hypothetical protein
VNRSTIGGCFLRHRRLFVNRKGHVIRRCIPRTSGLAACLLNFVRSTSIELPDCRRKNRLDLPWRRAAVRAKIACSEFGEVITAEGTMISIADAIDADALRVRHEFLDMPGLVLTVAQTAKLYALSNSHARALLDSLVAEGFLIGDAGSRYRRPVPPISA